MNFEIKTEPLSDRAFAIAIAGEVDLYVAPELKQQLLEVIERGATEVVVDLTDATFIDSTTLGVLIGAVRRLRTTTAGSRSSATTATSPRRSSSAGSTGSFDDLPRRARRSRVSTASSGSPRSMTPPRRDASAAPDTRGLRALLSRVRVPGRRLRRRGAHDGLRRARRHARQGALRDQLRACHTLANAGTRA